MAAKLTKTNTPGIFRRHVSGCAGGRCDCAYVVVWRHRGRQHKATFRTMAGAREAKGRKDAGERRPASRQAFEDYARGWLESYRGRTSRGLSESTRRTYRRDMENWTVPHFRGFKLAEIEPPDVREFIARLEAAGLRPSSIRSVLAPLKAMYATAVEDGAVAVNPTREVRVGVARTEPDREPARALTRAELSRLLAAIPEGWQLLFEVLAHSGLRISELAGLEWRDVVFGERPRLRVRRQDCRGEVRELKTEGSRREVPLSPRMARRLFATRRGRAAGDRVFTSRRGWRINYNDVRRRVLIPATEAAGLGRVDEDGTWRTWVTFHTFRHTCASLLFEAGRDVKQVAAMLGHADPTLTLRTYVHLMDDGIGDVDFLDDVVVVGSRGNTGATRRQERAALPAAADPAETSI
jgi:integrase